MAYQREELFDLFQNNLCEISYLKEETVLSGFFFLS